MANSLNSMKKDKVQGWGQFRCKFPSTYNLSQGEAFKLLPRLNQYCETVGQAFNMQSNRCFHEPQGLWMPFFKKHIDRPSVPRSLLWQSSAASLMTGKFLLKCQGWSSSRGSNCGVCAHRWTGGVPSLHFFNKLRDSEERERGQTLIHCVSRRSPAPIRKLSLCKFNDGDRGGKTSCFKI